MQFCFYHVNNEQSFFIRNSLEEGGVGGCGCKLFSGCSSLMLCIFWSPQWILFSFLYFIFSTLPWILYLYLIFPLPTTKGNSTEPFPVKHHMWNIHHREWMAGATLQCRLFHLSQSFSRGEIKKEQLKLPFRPKLRYVFIIMDFMQTHKLSIKNISKFQTMRHTDCYQHWFDSWNCRSKMMISDTVELAKQGLCVCVWVCVCVCVCVCNIT